MSTGGAPLKVWYLRRLDIFLSLTDQEIDDIARVLDDRHVPAGTELLQDRQREQLCIVKGGAVQLNLGTPQQHVTVALLGPGRLFGFASAFGDASPTIGATALEPSYLCFGTVPKLLELFRQYPEVMVRLTQALAEQIFFAETWVERANLHKPRGRLASLLLDLCDQFGEPVAGGQWIRFRLTQADLARMLGLARETVSRLMADFNRAGLITLERGLIVLPRRAALEELTQRIDGE